MFTVHKLEPKTGGAPHEHHDGLLPLLDSGSIWSFHRNAQKQPLMFPREDGQFACFLGPCTMWGNFRTTKLARKHQIFLRSTWRTWYLLGTCFSSPVYRPGYCNSTRLPVVNLLPRYSTWVPGVNLVLYLY